MELKDIALLITAIASIVAVCTNIIFQRKLYLIQKSKENENELFKKKLESYSEILRELNVLVFFLYEKIIAFHKHSHIYTNDELEKIADEIDDEVDKFDNLTIEKSLYFSAELEDKISDLVLKLYDSTTLKEVVTKENYKDYHQKLLNLSNEINEIMREELQLEKLNSKLYNRNRI